MKDNKQGAIRLNRREAINIGLGTVLSSAVAATGAGFAAATRWAGADDKPLTVLGDAQRQFELTLEYVSIALRDDRRDQPVLDVMRFGSLVLRQGVLENSGQTPGLVAREADTVWLDGVRWVPQRAAPYLLEQVETLRTGRANDESSSVRGTFQKAQ